MHVKNRYLIEDPFFVSSQYRNLSQLADLTAWTIHRIQLAGGHARDTLAADLFKMVEARFDRDKNGNYIGVHPSSVKTPSLP
jgi:hypothetical protein